MDTNSSITSVRTDGPTKTWSCWSTLTTRNRVFAECMMSGTRQTTTLPSVEKTKTLGKKKHSKILVLTCVISSVLVEPVFSKLHRTGWFLGHAQCCKFDIYFYCIINSMNIERKLNLQLHNREESHLFPTISSFYWFYPKPQKNMVDGGRPQVALRRGLHEKLERKSLVRRLLDLINKLHPVEGRRINDGDWFL